MQNSHRLSAKALPGHSAHYSTMKIFGRAYTRVAVMAVGGCIFGYLVIRILAHGL